MTPVVSKPGGIEPDLVGKSFGHFQIVGKLGAGGMGVVYKALDTKLKREVALKFLPHALAGEKDVLTRFEREAEAVAALNHPNIITIHSVENIDGKHFIVMELVAGRSLDRVIPSGGASSEVFLKVAIDLADALAAAHERGIVHRDLKPGNIMQTESGLIKVLDFGLAKLFEQVGDGDDDETLLADDLTRTGTMLGTPAYMSPEQVKADQIDHRTDLFSLGVIFYEMLTGKRPFGGGSPAEIVSGILRDRPTAMVEVRDSIPRSLSRIVDHCLEKDPDLRFQTAKELRHQLLSLKREFESDEILETAQLSRERAGPHISRRLSGRLTEGPLIWGGAAIGLLALATTLYFGVTPSADKRPAAVVEEAAQKSGAGEPEAAGELRPSLALLHFRNLTSDSNLQWLQAGLPEMLFTSLSQAAGLEILPTDRVYEILKEIGTIEDISPGSVREFAARGEAANLLTGTFAQLGESFRVAIKVEEAETGRVVLAEQVEGVGESSLFSLVDRLSQRVLDELDIHGTEEGEPSQEIMAVTTASMAAYRYYTEAIRLRRETKREEALSLLEKAVEHDPGFAMALSNISTGYLNMGDDERAREYASRAFENSARAPARERYYIQGMFLGLEWVTYVEAIGALQRAVDSYPDHDAARRNLAFYLAQLERYEEAIPHYRELVSKRPLFGGNYYLLTWAYDALDRFDEGQEISSRYLRESSGNWYGYLLQGWHQLWRGDAAGALKTFEEADSRRPGTHEVVESQWVGYVLLERWQEAAAAAASLASSPDPYYRWLGNVYAGRSDLYQGRTQRAVESMRAAAAGFSKPGAQPGMAHVWTADLLLLLGNNQGALEAATEAQRMGRGQWPQLNGQFLAGLALERLGRPDEADRVADELQRRVDVLPNNVERRQALHLAGLLDRSRGNLVEAIDKLTRAVALLPPHGFSGTHRVPDHAQLWFSLAETLLQAGRASEAAGWFERVVENRVESYNFPVRWTRSIYHLGEIYERLGESERARGYFRRFVDLWKDGDLDRDRLALAEGKL